MQMSDQMIKNLSMKKLFNGSNFDLGTSYLNFATGKFDLDIPDHSKMFSQQVTQKEL